MHQDARLYLTALAEGQEVRHALAPGRGAWLQVISGKVSVNGQALAEGDGVSTVDERELRLTGTGEALLFDLA